MTPDSWERIKQSFQAALERSPEERPDFLLEACRGDAKLQAEVEKLLQPSTTPATSSKSPPSATSLREAGFQSQPSSPPGKSFPVASRSSVFSGRAEWERFMRLEIWNSVSGSP